MRPLYLQVLCSLLTCGFIAGCGNTTETTSLGAMDPSEEMGMEEENIKPVRVPASEV
ncbi:hypothetical protein CA85_23000 [Allorhodopirellula solitaria]|uniref:Secreted protein n=1 Tax=Allorhodopirellula solitaria TaxID=2527987 RepID=A0A5C5XY10_9BACT|nr:hypothetical protein CA85_23000 [Allorhodopirellula solitaria]